MTSKKKLAITAVLVDDDVKQRITNIMFNSIGQSLLAAQKIAGAHGAFIETVTMSMRPTVGNPAEIGMNMDFKLVPLDTASLNAIAANEKGPLEH